MTEEPHRSAQADDLRRQAEAKATVDEATATGALSPEETQRVLHELRVHQIELEMQNEELRRAQVELDESRARYFDLYDFAPVGYVTLSDKGLILEANLTAATLFGVARNALIKRPFSHFIFPEDQDSFYRYRNQLLETGTPQVSELRMLRVNAAPFWARVEACIAQNASGAPALRTVVSDITVHKQAEEALREADTRKDVFLAMLGHELRNPLVPIANAVDILRISGSTKEMQHRAHDMIDRQVTHLVRLVDDLLDVSRISRGKILLRKEVFNLVPVVHHAVEDQRPFLEACGLRLDTTLPRTPLQMDGDATRIAQIVGNLLTNAGKFTPKGGQVSVELKTAGDHTARIVVGDTGVGIEPELLTHIFKPFHQGGRIVNTSRSGLGLGLALVKELAELHGGTVRATAGLERGSQFIVTLPLLRQPVDIQASVPEAVVSTPPRRVLLIEDDDMAAESLRMLLELDGHTVAVAYTGSDGVAQAKVFKPELVISDIGLPGGMDGHAVARALRHDPEVPHAYMVAYSGFGQARDERESRQAGFDEHLIKPIRMTDLQRLLARVPALADARSATRK